MRFHGTSLLCVTAVEHRRYGDHLDMKIWPRINEVTGVFGREIDWDFSPGTQEKLS